MSYIKQLLPENLEELDEHAEPDFGDYYAGDPAYQAYIKKEEAKAKAFQMEQESKPGFVEPILF